MELKNQKSLKAFLIFILFFSFTPLIQLIFEPIKLKGLEGAFVEAEKPVFSYSNWTTSKFQNQVSIYLKQKTPFRADFVRLRNQLNYWLFDEINTIFTLGKDNYIFDPNYIKARTGEDYISNELQHQKIESIKNAKQILDSLEIPIIVLIAPNKANKKAKSINLFSPYFSNIKPEGIDIKPYAIKNEKGKKPAIVSLSSKLFDTLGFSAPNMLVKKEMTKKVIRIRTTILCFFFIS